MGISTVIATALKGVSWQKVAGLAMEYGPELYRQARGRMYKDEQQQEQQMAEAELRERIDRLENLLVEQEELIRRQAVEGEQLKETCHTLERRLKLYKCSTAVLAAVTLLVAVTMLAHG